MSKIKNAAFLNHIDLQLKCQVKLLAKWTTAGGTDTGEALHDLTNSAIHTAVVQTRVVVLAVVASI